jgi:hypothetical protein
MFEISTCHAFVRLHCQVHAFVKQHVEVQVLFCKHFLLWTSLTDGKLNELLIKNFIYHYIKIFDNFNFLDYINILSQQYLSRQPPFDLQIPGISKTCQLDSHLFITSLKRFDLWAMKSELLR